ncbi:MAG: DUF4388 domain-containing protein [Myxococcales bacterium]
MALKGTLKDFGIADILQLIGQQGKTGVLHLSNRENEVHIAFKDGNVVRAESATRKKKELLGRMLVRAQLIKERQLEEALEEQRRTLKRLGDVLVANGAITRELLREMTQLQTTETLYRLFAWKSGTYEFEVAEVEFDAEAVTPIRSESVLMEGFRQVDEWPVIRKKITSSGMTFERLKELKGEARSADDDFDAAFDDAFGEVKTAEPEEDEGEFKSIGANERAVFKLVEPGRDVQTIIDLSRLGEFETCKALNNLVNLGYLRAIPAANRGEALGAVREQFADRLVAISGRVAMTIVLLAALALVASQLNLQALTHGGLGARHFADPAIQRFFARAQLARLRSAIDVYVIEKGSPPDTLSALVEAGILTEDDLRYPWNEPYYYRKGEPRGGGSAYLLLPPLQ